MLKILVAGAFLVACAVHAEETDADRVKRWKGIEQAVFADRPVLDGAKLLAVEAPDRALDAALVPVAVKITGKSPVKGLYVLVDDNPVPLAAHFTFGPAADPREVRIRVRVEQYTYIHAVAEGADGKLYGAAKFVKAAGGCSAPAGLDDKEALRDLGAMKLQTLATFTPGKTMQVQLHIKHPNFNGMQMDQLTRLYRPARFINDAEVSYAGQQVFHFEGGISMSSDPAITFGFKPKEKGELAIVAHDNNETLFEHVFPMPLAAAEE
jgi:sulfur-oxidizing protein SoxY